MSDDNMSVDAAIAPADGAGTYATRVTKAGGADVIGNTLASVSFETPEVGAYTY